MPNRVCSLHSPVEDATSTDKIIDATFNYVEGTVTLIAKPVPELFDKRVSWQYTGNLLQFIATTQLTEDTKLRICVKLLFIVLELHRKGILHGSICAANVMITGETITITNAGLYNIIQHRLKHIPLLPCTTYRSREELMKDDYTPSKSGDMYSLSVLIYTIFSGEEPYSSTVPFTKKVYKVCDKGHLGLRKPSSMPSDLWSALAVYWGASYEARNNAFKQVEASLHYHVPDIP